MTPSEVTFRLGHTVATWGGVNRDAQPGNIPPHQFRDLVNVRFRPNGIGNRGGKRKWNPDSQLDGCPTGIFPAESTPRNYTTRLVTHGGRDVSENSNSQLSLFADGLEELEAPVDPLGYASEGLTYTPGVGAGGAGGVFAIGYGFIGADIGGQAARRLRINVAGDIEGVDTYDPDPGNDSGWVGPSVAFDGTDFALTSQDTNGITVRARVYQDPAGAAVAERTVNSADNGFRPMWLVVDTTLALLVCPLEAGAIHYRNTSAAWASAALPIGASALRNTCNAGCSVSGTVYFIGREIGGAYAIIAFDGAACSTVHTVNGAPGTYGCVANHDGILYYGYRVGGVTGIGKRSQAGVFTDAIKTFTTTREVYGLVSSNGRLWALLGDQLWSSEFPEEPDSWVLEATDTSAFVDGAAQPIASGPPSTTVAQDNYVTTNAPAVYRNTPGSRLFEGLAIPAGVDSYEGARCDSVEFNFRRIFVGQFSRGLLATPGKVLVTLGITAPTVAPVLAAVGGGTIPAGNHIWYYSWVHIEDGVDIHESDLSPGSNTLTLTGTQQRQWTLPVVGAEDRVTHYRLYVSIDGAIPVFVEDVAYPAGGPTHTEDISDYGATPPVDADGNLLNARGVPPYARFCTKWKNRVAYGPDPDLPYRFWLSEPDEPESVGPLNYFDLTDRESLTLLKSAGDDLACAGAHVFYTLTGYDELDFFFHKVSSAIGCINYFAAAVINEILWFPGQLGVWNYVPGGAFRYMMEKDVSSEWETQYAASPSLFENSIAINDRVEHVYMLMLRYGEAPRDRRWIGSYRDIDPAMGGQGPMRWSFDECDRASSTLGILLNANSLRYEVYSGACDGWIRKENQYDDDDDDGDTGLKTMRIERPHFLPKRAKGSNLDGAKLLKLTVFMESERNAWTIQIRCGDEKAYLAAEPTKSYPVRASAATRVGRSLVPKSSHTFTPQVVGKGWILRYIAPRALGMVYTGEWYAHTGGSSGRPRQ